MDSTDVRIFCEMSSNNSNYSAYHKSQASAANIGEKLKLDEKTVRSRIRKMERDGFIKYYQATPNLSLFDLRSIGSFRFEALNLATKHSVVKKMSGIPQLVEGFDYMGVSVGATFAGATSEDVGHAAEVLANRFELEKTSLGERAVKEPLSKPDALDWQVIRELRYDARAKMRTIAGKLGVTPRMVEYRTSKLLASGSILVHPVIDAKKQAGLIFFELQISFDENMQSDTVRKIKEIHGVNLWSFTTPTSGTMAARFFGFSLGEPEEVALSVQKLEGVKTCFPFVLIETIEPDKPNWVDRLIDRAIYHQVRARTKTPD